MRSSNPLLLVLSLVGLLTTACGEGLLTPEEEAEYGDGAYDTEESALFPRGDFGGIGGGAVVDPDDDGSPNEVPVCPDCYVQINTSSGYVSSLSPLLMTVRDRLPRNVSSISYDKLDIRTSAGTLLASFELNGFEASQWLASQGQFFWASNVSTTAMPTSQRLSSNWGGQAGYTAKVRLRVNLTTGGYQDLYIPIAVRQPTYYYNYAITF
jgi:hypothetical protein